MEIKKKDKVSLENKTILFKEFGLVAALALFLAALALKNNEKPVAYDTIDTEIKKPAEKKITQIISKEQNPPPEKAKIPVAQKVLEIVDEDLIIPDVPAVVKTEGESKLKVEISTYYEEHIVVNESVAERKEKAVEEEFPSTAVEEKPSFQGGDENSFTKWVSSKVEYPEIARENGVQGRVILQFIVGTDGSVSDVKVIREVNELLDKEAMRVIASSPRWKPGRQKHKPVKVRYTFPVIFQLR